MLIVGAFLLAVEPLCFQSVFLQDTKEYLNHGYLNQSFLGVKKVGAEGKMG